MARKTSIERAELPDAGRSLERLFAHRKDTYAVQRQDGSYNRINCALSPKVLENHLIGKITVGAYQADNGMVRWICGDLDGKGNRDLRACATALRQAALDRGVPSSAILIEWSGRRGYHVWIFFAGPVPLSFAYNFGMELAAAAKVPSTVKDVHLEIFPKQAQIPPDGFGNLVKLPLGIHRVSGKRSFFCVPIAFEPAGWEVMKGVWPWNCPRDLIERLSKPPEHPEHVSEAPLLAEGDYPCWVKISKGQIPEGARHDAALALARHLRDRKLSLDIVLQVMRKWWERLPQPPETKAPMPWENVRQAVVDAYKHRYAVGCKTIQKKWPALCDPKCPMRESPAGKKKGKSKISGVTSGRFGDSLFEMVYREGKLQFCVFDLKSQTWNFVDEIEIEGVVHAPWPPALEMVKRQRLYLPSEPAEFGSALDLSKEIQNYLHTYTDYQEEFEKLDSWYAFLSWIYDRVNNLCYRRSLGDYGHGKSRWMLTLGSICRLAFIQGAAATPAAIFRLSDSIRGTQLIDETSFDKRTEVGQAMSQVLNCGFDRIMGVVTRCTGEDQVPRQFTVFGPKLIAAREPFMDVATESRTITNIAYRTQRKDIPIDLDEGFWHASLSLRNKLLLWRFKNLGDPPDRDREFERLDVNPRLKQIMLPLASLIQDETTKKFLKELARTLDKKITQERGVTLESTVIDAILDIRRDREQLSIGRIAERVREIENITDPDGFSARKCGGIVKYKLNLERKRAWNPDTRSNPITVVWDDKKMERLLLTYGKPITLLTSITLSGREGDAGKQKEAGKGGFQQPLIEDLVETTRPTVPDNVNNVNNVIVQRDQADRIRRVFEIIGQLEGQYEGGAPIPEISRIAESEGIAPSFVDVVIDQGKRGGILYEPKPGFLSRAVKHEKTEEKTVKRLTEPEEKSKAEKSVNQRLTNSPEMAQKAEPTTQDIVASVHSFSGSMIFKEKIAARAKCTMDRLNVVLEELEKKRAVKDMGRMVEVF